VRAFEMPGVNGELVQTITLLAHEPRVRLEAYFNKADVLDPESLYFAFPFSRAQAQAHFDCGGVPVAFDRDQLPGASRGWMAVGDWIAVAGTDGCLVVACPDAPMFQVGGFNYGRVVKNAGGLNQALLLAWPMNNYWHTNFRASQPGFIRFRYEIALLQSYDPAACSQFGGSCTNPLIFHPLAL
jgi:alpha-mannosidase